jgi:hypothetical protein
MPLSVDGQSIRRSDSRLHPATAAHDDCAARSGIRTTAETRSSGPGKIHRCDAVGMIAKEGLPALRRRSASPRHVLCDRGLPDIDAELEQFAVYPRSAPARRSNGRARLASRDCGGTSRTNSFAPQPLPDFRAISSNSIAGYASALLVFALHTGLAHERRIFPIGVEKAYGEREYHDDHNRMHLAPLPQSN